jgi:uncharacterized RDD family membrane protein YckC
VNLPDPLARAGAAAVHYAGFWKRLFASVIDTAVILFLVVPLLGSYYGWDYFIDDTRGFISGRADFFISYVLPAIATVVFWLARQATPGKIVLSMKIVDAETGGPITTGQAIGRYLGYYVSLVVLLLGFIWVAFDARKQGWHDKLAGTVVVYTR